MVGKIEEDTPIWDIYDAIEKACKEAWQEAQEELLYADDDGSETTEKHSTGNEERDSREKALYGSNGPIYAHDNYTGKYEKTFATYEDLRNEWPSAEITGYKMLAPGKGCIIYS